jgi:hypothetical protein
MTKGDSSHRISSPGAVHTGLPANPNVLLTNTIVEPDSEAYANGIDVLGCHWLVSSATSVEEMQQVILCHQIFLL